MWQFLKSLKEIVSEKTGRFSCTRTMMVVVILACIVWTTRIVWNAPPCTESMPTTLPDIPIQWAGLIALLYGLNKFSPQNNDQIRNA